MPVFEEVIERRFAVGGRASLSAQNVAGDTVVQGRSGEEIVVRVRKRAEAENADRAKRLLENLEIAIEQVGDEVRVSQRAYLVERSWLGLFGDHGAVAADYVIEVPQRCDVGVHSTSGEIRVEGVAGELRLVGVSGGLRLQGATGELELRSVSGDVKVTESAGSATARTVSGELSFERCALTSLDVDTVSGDLRLESALPGPGPYTVRSASGDVIVATPSDCTVRFKSMSGDARLDGDGRVEKAGRRKARLRLGEGGVDVYVRTISGDLRLRRQAMDAPAAPPAPVTARADEGKSEVLGVLERVSRGELDADDAARLLDALR